MKSRAIVMGGCTTSTRRMARSYGKRCLGACPPSGYAPSRMLTEEAHSAGVLEAKVAQHEDAAHEKRNWVRLTFDCNNRCIFCLDSDAHDGRMRDEQEIKRQILDGRRKGATRLI